MKLAGENGFHFLLSAGAGAPRDVGTGFLGAHSEEVYRLEADDLYLVGTSEVPLAGYHANEILDLSDGPPRWPACRASP